MPALKPKAKPKPVPDSDLVTVHFGTTREYANGRFKPVRKPVVQRGSIATPISPILYGTVDVLFERLPDPSGLESMAIREIASRFAAECSFIDYAANVQQPTALDKEAFWKSLEMHVQSTSANALIVFIHGFNNSFDEAASRAAILSRKLRAPAAFFSWPSQETVMGYKEDARTIESSQAQIAQFVRNAIDASNAEQVLLIAHSMGSRALLHVLADLTRSPTKNKVVPYVVFAAPDVGADQFLLETGKLAKGTKGMTIYGSKYDEPLQISKWVNPKEGLRAGDVRAFDKRYSRWLTTIDASRAAAEMVGHSYFANSSAVLNDIFGLFRLDRSPADRGLSILKKTKDIVVYEVR